jgi:hypothetical protein
VEGGEAGSFFGPYGAAAGAIIGAFTGGKATSAVTKAAFNGLGRVNDFVASVNAAAAAHPNYETGGELVGGLFSPTKVTGTAFDIATSGGAIRSALNLQKLAQVASADAGKLGATKVVASKLAQGAAAGALFEASIRPALDHGIAKVQDLMGIEHEPVPSPTLQSIGLFSLIGVATGLHNVQFSSFTPEQISSIAARGGIRNAMGVDPSATVSQADMDAALRSNGINVDNQEIAGWMQPLTAEEGAIFQKIAEKVSDMNEAGLFKGAQGMQFGSATVAGVPRWSPQKGKLLNTENEPFYSTNVQPIPREDAEASPEGRPAPTPEVPPLGGPEGAEPATPETAEPVAGNETPAATPEPTEATEQGLPIERIPAASENATPQGEVGQPLSHGQEMSEEPHVPDGQPLSEPSSSQEPSGQAASGQDLSTSVEPGDTITDQQGNRFEVHAVDDGAIHILPEGVPGGPVAVSRAEIEDLLRNQQVSVQKAHETEPIRQEPQARDASAPQTHQSGTEKPTPAPAERPEPAGRLNQKSSGPERAEATEQPAAHKVTPYGPEDARKAVRQALANRSTKMRVAVQEGETSGDLGAEMRDGKVIVHPGRMARQMNLVREAQRAEGIEGTPEAHAHAVIAEEIIHVGQHRLAKAEGTNIFAKYGKLADSGDLPKGWYEAVREARPNSESKDYADLSHDEKARAAAEFERMALQGRWHGRITESFLRHLQKVVEFLKATAKNGSEAFRKGVDRLERVLNGLEVEESNAKENPETASPAEPFAPPAKPESEDKTPTPEATPTKQGSEVSKEAGPASRSGASRELIDKGKKLFEGLQSEPVRTVEQIQQALEANRSRLAELSKRIAAHASEHPPEPAERFEKKTLQERVTELGKNLARARRGEALQSEPVPDQLPFPPDRFPALLELAHQIGEEGIKTPEGLAAFLDEAVGPKAQKYAQAVWDIMGAVGHAERGTHDWGKLFAPPEKSVTRPDKAVRDHPLPPGQKILTTDGRDGEIASISGNPESREYPGAYNVLFKDGSSGHFAGWDVTPVREEPSEGFQEKQPNADETAQANVKAEVKTVTKPAASKDKVTTKGTQDFGEKIGGARKDRWKGRGLDVADMEQMTPEERQGYAVKAEVYPQPDYQKWIDDGNSIGFTHLLKKVRDSIAPEPVFSRGGDREAERNRYVELVGKIRDGLPAVKTPEQLRAFLLKTFPVTGHEKYSQRFTHEAIADLRILGGKVAKAMQVNSYDEARAERKAQETGWPAKQEAWQRQFKIRQASDRDWEVLKRDRGSNRGVQGGFTSEADAIAFAKEQAKKAGPKEIVRPINPDLKRIGVDDRNGKDVTGQDLIDRFGFRGGEFGNWTNEADRKQSLNQAYDGLMDLARQLGIPPKAVSLNGSLGIAFGARGGGRFGAHYEPTKVVINLTRTRGAGALAHEWAHAVDDYFGKQATGASARYLSHASPGSEAARTKEVRPEVLEAWAKVMNRITRKVGIEKGSGATDILRWSRAQSRSSDGYWARLHELFARSFEGYLAQRIEDRGESSPYLVQGVPTAKDPVPKWEDAYPRGEEAKAINEAFDELWNVIEHKTTDAGEALFSEPAPAPHFDPLDKRSVEAGISRIAERTGFPAVKLSDLAEELGVSDSRMDAFKKVLAAMRKSGRLNLTEADNSLASARDKKWAISTPLDQHGPATHVSLTSAAEADNLPSDERSETQALGDEAGELRAGGSGGPTKGAAAGFHDSGDDRPGNLTPEHVGEKITSAQNRYRGVDWRFATDAEKANPKNAAAWFDSKTMEIVYNPDELSDRATRADKVIPGSGSRYIDRAIDEELAHYRDAQVTLASGQRYGTTQRRAWATAPESIRNLATEVYKASPAVMARGTELMRMLDQSKFGDGLTENFIQSEPADRLTQMLREWKLPTWLDDHLRGMQQVRPSDGQSLHSEPAPNDWTGATAESGETAKPFREMVKEGADVAVGFGKRMARGNPQSGELHPAAGIDSPLVIAAAAELRRDSACAART